MKYSQTDLCDIFVVHQQNLFKFVLVVTQSKLKNKWNEQINHKKKKINNKNSEEISSNSSFI